MVFGRSKRWENKSFYAFHGYSVTVIFMKKTLHANGVFSNTERTHSRPKVLTMTAFKIHHGPVSH